MNTNEQSSGKGPASENIRYVNLYEKENKIYTRKITGFFQNIRRYTGLPLIIGYVLLPWFVIDGRPAVFFDLPARQFHIGWVTFWPQDFMLLGWLLIIAAFMLFSITVLWGRVWCGFTCPQTVWTLMFISVEHFFEGDRNRQIKLDSQNWNVEKIWRKSAKHFFWVLIAFITGVTFVGYFYPIRTLLSGLLPGPDPETGILQFGAPVEAVFWTFFFTFMTYMNAGWLREQVCKYMCPYARFQSAMYDDKTLAVHYDSQRGEQRGARKAGVDRRAEGLGDCVDCSWCVQVCPVDIDIRDGLQYECINCGLCVDACNAVMDKMEYPRGLIRFTSEDALKNGVTRILRPRLIGYSLGVWAMIAALAWVLFEREPLGIDIIRDRGARLYRIRGEELQNVYTLKIANMDKVPHQYKVELSGDLDYRLENYRPVLIEAGEVFTVPLRVAVDKNKVNKEKSLLNIKVIAFENADILDSETTVFVGPYAAQP